MRHSNIDQRRPDIAINTRIEIFCKRATWIYFCGPIYSIVKGEKVNERHYCQLSFAILFPYEWQFVPRTSTVFSGTTLLFPYEWRFVLGARLFFWQLSQMRITLLFVVLLCRQRLILFLSFFLLFILFAFLF